MAQKSDFRYTEDMMAGLFVMMALSVGAQVAGSRSAAILLFVIGMLLAGALFWHLATDTLKIMW